LKLFSLREERKIKILLGHTSPKRIFFGESWLEGWLSRLRSNGFDVTPFSLIVNQSMPVMFFSELNFRWRNRDKDLLEMYERLQTELEGYDAFICFNGANIHPEFVKSLSVTTVYGCFDDPESSEKLSMPVAPSFDIAMVGNIAELEAYRKWGCENVYWWPLGFRYEDYNPLSTERQLFESERSVDVTLLCERETRYRIKRVDKFANEFKNGKYYGKGWPSGFLDEEFRIPLLQDTKIGINIHNSTGPINFRTFYLPANGVMQICDNKSNLGKIFELNKEVIGYNSIEEAIELTHYYLKNPDERLKIAKAGWNRALSDYNEVKCFQRVVDAIKSCEVINKKSALLFDNITHQKPVQKYKLTFYFLYIKFRKKISLLYRNFL